MNEAFFKHALDRLNELTPADIKEVADRVGLPLVSKYSGTKLSEVPYEDIWIGMEVTGCNGDDGKVIEKQDRQGNDEDNFIHIEWKSTSTTTYQHCWHDNVTVK